MSDKDDTKRAKYIDNSFQSKEQLIEEVVISKDINN